MDLKFYLSLFTRRLPWFLLLLALGSAVGITLARVLPPVYLAEALLVVESEQIPGELASSTVRTQATEQLQIIQQRILTRDRLLEMANQLSIYDQDASRASRRMTAEDIVEDLRARVQIVTTGGSATRGAVQATLVRVSFEAPTPTLSASVTNRLVTLILQEDVGMRTNVARQTLDFFVQEVARLDQELATRGAAILKFKQENLTALPDSLEFRRSQQAADQDRLAQLQQGEKALIDRRERLVQLYGETGQVGSSVPAAQATPEQRQLQELRDNLSRLLAVLSPENPRVTLLKAQIAGLEKVVAEQVTGAATSEDGKQLSPYEIQLADIDGQLAFVANQKSLIEANMEKLRVSIEATAGNAIALDTLERDYSNLRVQYDQAVANKARAETGDMIEALSKGQKISVIEQAVAPREPEKPNRLLIMAGGVGAGLFAGLGLVVLLELLNSAIRRPTEVVDKLGITPLATLPYLRSKSEARRRRAILFLAFALVLGAIPAGLWLVHTQYMPLDLLLDQIRGKLAIGALMSASLPVAA